MKTEAELRELYQAAGQARSLSRTFVAPALRSRPRRASPHPFLASRAAAQGHVFEFWDECDATEREALLAQLREIDPHAVNTVRRHAIRRPSVAACCTLYCVACHRRFMLCARL